MGEGRRRVEGKFRMKAKFWGLRPWKRHSLVLMVAGIMYIAIGVGYIFAPPSRVRDISLAVLLQVAPIIFWGTVFVIAGLLSILSAIWPPHAEKWGYMVLTGLSFGWGSAYLMGIVFAGSPWTNVNGFAVWGSIGFFLWAISGLQNPDKTVVMSTNGSG